MASVPIKAERLTRYYGKRRGVIDLTFEVQEDEILNWSDQAGLDTMVVAPPMSGVASQLGYIQGGATLESMASSNSRGKSWRVRRYKAI